MKFFKWLIKSALIALVIIFLINICGAYFNINIPLNIWTLTLITFLRLPGAIVLIVFMML